MANSKIVNTANEISRSGATTHEQNTISNTAEDVLNQALDSLTQNVLVQFNGAACRVTFDGTTNPTTSLGFLYNPGDTGLWSAQQARNAKAIRAASTDCVIEYQELSY